MKQNERSLTCAQRCICLHRPFGISLPRRRRFLDGSVLVAEAEVRVRRPCGLFDLSDGRGLSDLSNVRGLFGLSAMSRRRGQGRVRDERARNAGVSFSGKGLIAFRTCLKVKKIEYKIRTNYKI